ncbi:MAG: hypothetical protein AAF125_20395 [Chloroflexota bacterium]
MRTEIDFTNGWEISHHIATRIFTLPEPRAGRRVHLEIEGATGLTVNGVTPNVRIRDAHFDLSALLRPNENTLQAIVEDASSFSARLIYVDPVYIVTVRVRQHDLDTPDASLSVDVTLRNDTNTAVEDTLSVALYPPDDAEDENPPFHIGIMEEVTIGPNATHTHTTSLNLNTGYRVSGDGDGESVTLQPASGDPYAVIIELGSTTDASGITLLGTRDILEKPYYFD